MERIKCYDYIGNSINNLAQWDKNQVIYVDDCESGVLPRIHFSSPHNSEVSWEFEDNVVSLIDDRIRIKIPDLLMQYSGKLYIFLLYDESTDINVESFTTKYMTTVFVAEKPRPEDYPIVDETWYMTMRQIEIDIEELKSIDEDLKIQIDTKITNPSTGEVGQILEIASVDETGKPSTYRAINKEDCLPEEYATKEEVQQLAEEIADIKENGTGGSVVTIENYIDYDVNVKTISHRGYNTEAPENTIPAYVLARQKGYKYAECDVSFTSDGVAVLLHDSTIDRTSNGTGSILALTYEEVSQYDFGSWFSSDFTGTKIPTFEEFILLCRNIGLHPYIELKNNGGYTQEKVNGLVNIVKSKGMTGKVTWISYSSTFLGYVKNADDSARLGYLVDTTTEDKASGAVTTIQGLKTENNEVFADLSLAYLNDTKLQYFIEVEIPVEVYFISTDETTISEKVLSANGYITGFALDKGIAGKILYEEYMDYVPSEAPDVPDEPEKTLTNISATYTGGDVTVGIALTDLTGITVKATYSDGSTANVTGYTLSGTIAEGSNTITVSYGGKTTIFTVTGIVGGGDEPDIPDEPTTGLINSWYFTNGLTDSVGDITAKLNGSGIVQDSNGITVSGQYSQIVLGDIVNANRRIEIDVSTMISDFTGRHGKFICFDKTNVTGGTHQTGFVYRSTGSWQFYNKSWSEETENTDPNMFNEKTIVIEIGNDLIPKVYCDDVLIATSPSALDSTLTSLYIGDASYSYTTVIISAVRVYDIS